MDRLYGKRFDADNLGEVLFEFTPVGSIMRVAAVHASTGTEVIIQGPVNMPKSVLQNNALRKLRYVMRKEAEKSGG